MAQQDRDHHIVIQALKAAGWTVTHPQGIATRFAGKRGTVDIGAEIYEAEKGNRKIAVEVKNYPPTGNGVMGEFQRNVGQHLMYKEWFEENEPDREVYTAIPKATYDGFLSNQESQHFLRKHEIKMFTYNPDSQTLDKWID